MASLRKARVIHDTRYSAIRATHSRITLQPSRIAVLPHLENVHPVDCMEMRTRELTLHIIRSSLIRHSFPHQLMFPDPDLSLCARIQHIRLFVENIRQGEVIGKEKQRKKRRQRTKRQTDGS